MPPRWIAVTALLFLLPAPGSCSSEIGEASQSAQDLELKTYGLTAAIIKSHGYKNTPEGLIYLALGKIHTGPDKDAILKTISAAELPQKIATANKKLNPELAQAMKSLDALKLLGPGPGMESNKSARK